MATSTWGEMKIPMNQKSKDQPSESSDRQGAGLADVSTSQLRIFYFCLINQ